MISAVSGPLFRILIPQPQRTKSREDDDRLLKKRDFFKVTLLNDRTLPNRTYLYNARNNNNNSAFRNATLFFFRVPQFPLFRLFRGRRQEPNLRASFVRTKTGNKSKLVKVVPQFVGNKLTLL